MNVIGTGIEKKGSGWMSKIIRVMAVTTFILLLNILFILTPFYHQVAIENDLFIWFHLRGARTGPQEVAIVNLDKESASRLGLAERPEKWPRTIYAKLIDALARLHVATIVLDINFSDVRNPEENKALAKAMADAGNVVLFEYMKQQAIGLTGQSLGGEATLVVESIVPPLPVLANSAISMAPFPLPKVPVRLNQFWAFKSTLGDVPTLPVLALFLYSLKKEPSILMQLKELFPSIADELVYPGQIDKFIIRLRHHLLLHPEETSRALATLEQGKQGNNLVRAILQVCSGPETPFLNFYGPPSQISTIPCHKILLGSTDGPGGKWLGEKVVFIGAARKNPSEQKDGFYTVFTRPDGLDLSGVEIAATAFSNLLKMETAKPVQWWAQLLIIGTWTFFTALIAFFLPPVMSFLCFCATTAIYLFSGHFLFEYTSFFLPVMVPLLFPCLPAYLLILLWQYSRVRAERKNITEAFTHYLPPQVVDRLARDRAFISRPAQRLYGVCLLTDAQRYTSLSEQMDPRELAILMNRYYKTLFGPVKRHGGIVSDVLGDSMLAIWTGTKPAKHLKNSAAKTALDIIDALNGLQHRGQPIHLPTRIGLHSGYLALGHIGTPDHYEFTPIGDIVNTASRIEGLNKYLGTNILASHEVVKGAEDLLTREVGTFLLAGKSIPIVIYEIISTMEEASSAERKLCKSFARALQQFRDKKWNEALEGFMSCGEDGPARFYLRLCGSYLKDPPMDEWTGIVKLARK